MIFGVCQIIIIIKVILEKKEKILLLILDYGLMIKILIKVYLLLIKKEQKDDK